MKNIKTNIIQIQFNSIQFGLTTILTNFALPTTEILRRNTCPIYLQDTPLVRAYHVCRARSPAKTY